MITTHRFVPSRTPGMVLPGGHCCHICGMFERRHAPANDQLTRAASAVYRWALCIDSLGESFLVAKADEAAVQHGYTDAAEVLNLVEKRVSPRWYHHSHFYALDQIINERADGYRRSPAHRPQ